MFLISTPHKTTTFTVWLAVTTKYQGNGFATEVMFVLTECTNVTDTRTHTHTHTPHDDIGRACIASRGKNSVKTSFRLGWRMEVIPSIALYPPLQVKPKNRPGPAWPGHVKIALDITAVEFDQFSLYSTGTMIIYDRLSL